MKKILKPTDKAYLEIQTAIKLACLHMTNNADNSPKKNGSSECGIFYNNLNKRLLGTKSAPADLPKNPYINYVNKTATELQHFELSVSVAQYKKFLTKLSTQKLNPAMKNLFKHQWDKSPAKTKKAKRV